MKTFLLFFFIFFTPLFAQDFLFNQGKNRGEWVLDQQADTIIFNPNAGFIYPKARTSVLGFYRDSSDFFAGDYAGLVPTRYKAKGKHSFILEYDSKNRAEYFYDSSKNTLKSLRDGKIYLNKTWQQFVYEKIAGTYLNDRDTVRFYPDGHSENFYLDRNYFQLLRGDSFGLESDAIYFNQTQKYLPEYLVYDPNINQNNCCYKKPLFALRYTKNQLEFYDLIETTCSDCKPDYTKGQLLYTLKRLK